MIIPVYILPTNTPNISEHLYELFRESLLFNVINTEYYTGCIGEVDIDSEASQVIDALENASTYYTNDYCIVIKDNSVTNVTSDTLTELVLMAIGLNRKNKRGGLGKDRYVNSCDSCDRSSSCDGSGIGSEKSCDRSDNSCDRSDNSCDDCYSLDR